MFADFLRRNRICYSPEGEEGGGGAVSPTTPSAPPTPSSSAPVSAGSPSSTPSGDANPSPSSASDVGGGTGLNDPLAEGDSFDFEAAIFGDSTAASVSPVVEAVVPPQPTVVPPPAPEPQVPPQATAQPPAQPPVTPEPPQGQQSSSPLLDLAEPERLAQFFGSGDPQLLETFAPQFALSSEEAEAFENDPVGMLPKLTARAYLKAMQSVMNVMSKAVPAMIAKHTEAQTRNKTSEDAFYSRWKDAGLDKTKHGATVQRLAAVYRQMNPQASFQQMVEELGPMVIAIEKVQPAVAKPVAPTPNGRIPTNPFVPAGGSPPSSAPPALDASNDWSYLGQETGE